MEPGIEHSQNPETEQAPRYGAVISLGAGFVKKQSELGKSEQGIKLSQESRTRATAAAILAKNLSVPVIIFTGGKTAGKENPSEAGAMAEYIQRLFPGIGQGRQIIIEEKGMDTSGNAEYVAQIIRDCNIEGPVILISSEFHLERADHLFMQQGLDTTPIGAEDIVTQRSGHHKKFIEGKLRSYGNLKAEAIEAILRTMLIVDPSGNIPRKIAENTRFRGAVGDK